MKEKREKRITCRLTLAEYNKLLQSADIAGLSMSDYLRILSTVEPRKHRQAKSLKADPIVINQLARIGNNLNQIARDIHKTKIYNIQDNLLNLLMGLDRELERILYDCKNVEIRQKLD